MRILNHLYLIALAIVVSCAPAPDLPASFASEETDAAYPQLLPRSELVALTTGTPRITPESEDAMARRLAALRARAAQLSQPVVESPTRQRMQDAVAPAALR